jgi:hypothetical protein
MQATTQTKAPAANSNVLYHVKSHGVTCELTDNWNHAFTISEQLRRRLGSQNVQLITIRDNRTPAQRFPKQEH